MDSIQPSELGDLYQRLHGDPRRSLSQFCRVSVDYARSLAATSPERAREVAATAVDSIPTAIPHADLEVLIALLNQLDVVVSDLNDHRLTLQIRRRLVDTLGILDERTDLGSLSAESIEAHSRLVEAYVGSGDIAAAVGQLSDICALARCDSQELVSVVARELALLPPSRTDDVLALATLEQAVATIRQTCEPQVAKWAVAALLALRLRAHDEGGAAPYARRLAILFVDDHRPSIVSLLVARCRALNEHWNGCLEAVEPMIADQHDECDERIHYQALVLFGTAKFHLGELDVACDALGRALDHEFKDVYTMVHCHELLAEIAEQQHRHADAYRHMRIARDTERLALNGSGISGRMLDLRSEIIESDVVGIDAISSDGLQQRVDSLERMIEMKSRELEQALIDLRDLSDRSSTDSLTGAVTREQLRRTLQERVEQRDSVALLCIDIDRFSRLNETLGHHVGDGLLIEVSHRIRSCLSAEDLLARWGNDEFVVVLDGVDDPQAVADFAASVRTAVSQPWTFASVEIVPTISIGVAIMAGSRINADMLLRQADTALERAKTTRRGMIEVFGQSLSDDAIRRFDAEQLVRQGLEYGWFELYFQPVHSNHTGRPYAAEALIRLNHPDFGLLGPAAFLDVAEEVGLMPQLGRWVLHEALAYLEQWNHARPGFRIAINVSASQLTEGFAEEFEQILDGYNVDPRSLVLELTEHTLLEAGEQQVSALKAIRYLGVRLALDDFGTAYSSLAHLRSFPIDVVKIDRSFIESICESQHDQAIVKAVVDLSQTFGFRVIAEGVETAEQLDQQRKLGCHGAQGYLIGHPKPAADLAALMNGLNLLDAMDRTAS